MCKEDMIKTLETNTLSKYKTFHHFENYAEIKSLDDYTFYVTWAEQNKKDIFILGNGSNTLFKNKNVKSLVLKNNLPKEIKCISEEGNLFEVTTNVMMNEILNYCYKKSLDSFYFLASVPATIGGALAMNAGEGKHINKSIYNFVEYVTYIDNDSTIKKIKPTDMNIDYRETMFTGCQDKFIVSAVFKFPPKEFGEINPIKERVLWSKKFQDNVAPNCGTVFKEANHYIMGLLRRLPKVGKAQYSSKTGNWINNNSRSPLPILSLIFITKLLHKILLKKCKIEIILVE